MFDEHTVQRDAGLALPAARATFNAAVTASDGMQDAATFQAGAAGHSTRALYFLIQFLCSQLLNY